MSAAVVVLLEILKLLVWEWVASRTLMWERVASDSSMWERVASGASMMTGERAKKMALAEAG